MLGCPKSFSTTSFSTSSSTNYVCGEQFFPIPIHDRSGFGWSCFPAGKLYACSSSDFIVIFFYSGCNFFTQCLESENAYIQMSKGANKSNINTINFEI